MFLLAIVAVKLKEVGSQSSVCSVVAACAQNRVTGLPEKKGATATNGLNSPKRFQVATAYTVVVVFNGFKAMLIRIFLPYFLGRFLF